MLKLNGKLYFNSYLIIQLQEVISFYYKNYFASYPVSYGILTP